MEKLHEQDEESSLKSERLEVEKANSLVAIEGQVGGGGCHVDSNDERTDNCGLSISSTSRRPEEEPEIVGNNNSESQKQSDRKEESDVVVIESSSAKQKVLAEVKTAILGEKELNHGDDQDGEQNQQMRPSEKKSEGGASSRENAEHATLPLEEAKGASVDCCVTERVGGQVANGTFQAREAVVGHEHANFAQSRRATQDVDQQDKGQGKVRAVAATVDLSQDDDEQSELASADGGNQSAIRSAESQEDKSYRLQQQVAIGEDLQTCVEKNMASRNDQDEPAGDHRNRQQLAPVLAISSNSCSLDSSSNYKRQYANLSEVESDHGEEDEIDSSSCAGSNSLDGCNRSASTNLNCTGQQQRDQNKQQRIDYFNGSNKERQLLDDEGRDDNDDECCGEAASDLNLRKLKLSTIEDVLVCEQNRDSLDAARRLFGSLVMRQQHDCNYDKGGQHDDNHNLRIVGSLSSSSLKVDHNAHSKQVVCVGGFEDDEDELGRVANLSSPSPFSSADDDDENSFGGVKIVRNKNGGSSASSSNNFRQTLVCSVSPTSQLGGSSSDVSSTTNSNTHNNDKTMAAAPITATMGGGHPLYPIDGDEIRQCRTAFRENKRLIQEQQDRASRAEARSIEHSERSANVSSASSRASSRQRDRFERDYKRQLSQSTCSRCQQRVYPVDKLELDFTRATLNIHRNCFKCQVCSSLLRLETYSAIDAKLYCPAHVKSVTPGR